jgi:hypothetical protein
MKILLGSLHGHISDETLSRLISGELPSFRAFRVKSHIENCWRCRSRREALERAAMQLTEYRTRLTLSVPPDSGRRQQLLQSLRSHPAPSAQSVAWRRSVLRMQRWIGHQMTPLLASTTIVFVAGILLFFVWHRDKQTVTPSQFLARTVSAEELPGEHSGVIYQRVSIRSPRVRVSRDLYHDAKGIRHRRIEPVSQQEQPIKDVLSQAGVEWEAPLSANSYRDWHNQQHVLSDVVHQDDERHLTLVTTLQDGPVSQESLTVRLSDFHPIQRTVETRAYGTIEIAELSYAVLDWNAVNQALFDPTHSVQPSLAIHIPVAPSEGELDVAELSARVSLNRLHADEGEQINVVRTNQGVQVKGVVETNERKRMLISQLGMIPHVTTNILSITELESAPLHPSTAAPLKIESLDAGPSPLQTYLQGTNRQDKLDNSSQLLLNAALSIHHNAVLLEELQSRFGTSALDAESSYKALLASYAERVNGAVNTEISTLNQLGFADPTSAASGAHSTSLKASAERTESLCRELISGSPSTQRTAREIATELYQTVFEIRSSTQLDSKRK